MHWAVIDIGTNSVRLLVARVDQEGRIISTPLRLVRTPRLGQGITGGMLQEKAVKRTLEVLEEYREIIARYPRVEIRVVSTSIMRSVRNPELLTELIRQQFGWELRVLSGREEAYLSFLGAVRGTGLDFRRCMVTDIGGGSTELVYFKEELNLTSLDIGAVRLTEAFGEDAEAMGRKVRTLLCNLELDTGETDHLLGAGGTVSALARLEQQLKRYSFEKIHGYTMTRSQIGKWFTYFRSLKPEERKHISGLEPARGEIILAGTLILKEIMGHFDYERITVSETYLSEGIIWSAYSSDGLIKAKGEEI